MSLSGSPAGAHAAGLAADHYSSAVAHLRMAGNENGQSVRGPGAATEGRAALLLARAGVHADLALFCSRAAELGIDLRTQQEQEAEHKRERVAAGLDCPACGHPYFSHTVYPGGAGPNPEITASQYTVCGKCTAAPQSGPCGA